MKIPKLDKHYTKVAELKKELGNMADSFPFNEAARLADRVVQVWLRESPGKFSKETGTGGVFSWSLGGGWNVANEHCVRYVMFHHSSNGRTLIGLGYDLRHWILDGNAEQIPWRIWFDSLSPGFPEGVKIKLQGKPGLPGKRNKYGLQDAFAFDGMSPFFVLVPPKYLKGLERLPIEDDDKYVKKLAEAVSKFLDDLYTKS